MTIDANNTKDTGTDEAVVARRSSLCSALFRFASKFARLVVDENMEVAGRWDGETIRLNPSHPSYCEYTILHEVGHAVNGHMCCREHCEYAAHGAAVAFANILNVNMSGWDAKIESYADFSQCPKRKHEEMNYDDAKQRCHVRSAIRRRAKPEAKYWKNHTVPLDDRVPEDDKRANDWEEYDPREHPECSEYNETPA